MIERRRSKIQGWGVYATTAISKNKRIINYAGEKISNQESLKREARYIKKGHIWCFKLTNRTVIDAGVGGNVARFINHACKPNCWIELDVKNLMIWIRASRTIRKPPLFNNLFLPLSISNCLLTHFAHALKHARAN